MKRGVYLVSTLFTFLIITHFTTFPKKNKAQNNIFKKFVLFSQKLQSS